MSKYPTPVPEAIDEDLTPPAIDLVDVGGLAAVAASLRESVTAIAVVPDLLRVQAGQMGALLSWRDSSIRDSDKLGEAVGRLESRIGEINVLFARIESSVTSLGAQIGQVSASLKNEIAGIGDELATLEAKTGAAITALVKRVESLEGDRNRVKWTVAVLLALAAIFGWITRYLTGSK